MKFAWTRRGIEQLVWRTLDGESVDAIAARLGCEERTAIKMQFELDLRPRKPHHWWSSEDIAELRRLFPKLATREVAKQMGRSTHSIDGLAHKLGLKKSAERMQEMGQEVYARLGQSGRLHRFPKGHVPMNKGQRRPGWSTGRMRETQFKKGQMSGAAKANWKPIGTIQADPEGFLHVKVRERADQGEKGWHKNVWPLLHYRVWEERNGPVPAGYRLAFKDRDRANCDIGNLELVTFAEMMRRNTIHNLPPELKNTIMLLGAVKRRLRERAEKHNDGSAQPPVRNTGGAQGRGKADGPGTRQGCGERGADDSGQRQGRGAVPAGDRLGRRDGVLRHAADREAAQPGRRRAA